MCSLVGHQILAVRNMEAEEMDEHRVSGIVASLIFLNTRKVWNSPPPLTETQTFDIPEHLIFEAAHHLRRRVINWARGRVCFGRSRVSQAGIDLVGDTAVRAASTAGAMEATEGDARCRWALVEGDRNLGRLAVVAVRGGASPTEGPVTDEGAVPEQDGQGDVDMESDGPALATVAPKDAKEILLDIGIFQLTLRNSHPQVLPQEIARDQDVVNIFGRAPMQACLVERAVLRSTYKLVGSGHELAHWQDLNAETGTNTLNVTTPPLEINREYYVPELNASEKSWLPELIEPFRQSQLPLLAEIFLSDAALPDDAQVAYLCVRVPAVAGIAYEIFAYRARRMLHVYQLESHGRHFFRSLVYTTDARFTLRALQPSTAERKDDWPAFVRHEAGSLQKAGVSGGVVITRNWATDTNLSLGKEKYLPIRLLHGLLPQCLLDTHVLWQAEDEEIRGYPISLSAGCDLLLVSPSVGAHVSLYGSQFEHVSFAKDDPRYMLPAKMIVLKLDYQVCLQTRDRVKAALAALESFCDRHGSRLLSNPFEPDFFICRTIAKLLARITPITPTFAEALELIDVRPFLSLREELRRSAVLLPQLVAAAEAIVQSDVDVASDSVHAAVPPSDTPASDEVDGTAATPKPSRKATARAASTAEVDATELILLDVLHAPPGSFLFSLASTLTRIECLSHVTVWARYNAEVHDAILGDSDAIEQSDLLFVQLPRLKLSFEARCMADGSVALVSVDHADLYIANVGDALDSASANSLLEGIGHSLILTNSLGELTVLIPAVPPIRPVIRSSPFSSQLVLDRGNVKFANALNLPHYLIPVHLSQAFLSPTTLAAAAYLMLLRFQARAYSRVVELIDTIASDINLSPECANILGLMDANDEHPDATSCRLKISAALLHSPIVSRPNGLPWSLSVEMTRYLTKRTSVSAGCELTLDEEEALFDSGLIACDPDDPKVGYAAFSSLQKRNVLLLFNRRLVLQQHSVPSREAIILQVYDDKRHAKPSQAALLTPSRPAEWRWLTQWDSNVIAIDVEKQLSDALSAIDMIYPRQPVLVAFDLGQLLSKANVARGTHSCTEVFATLYELFQGAVCLDQLGGYRTIAASGSSTTFATLLTALAVDPPRNTRDPQTSIYSSLLLTLARVPELGPYLPPLKQTEPLMSRSRHIGASSAIGVMVKHAVQELQTLGTASVQKTMLDRRIESLGAALASQSQYGGSWGGRFGTSWGHSGQANGMSPDELEATVKMKEKECASELKELVDWAAALAEARTRDLDAVKAKVTPVLASITSVLPPPSLPALTDHAAASLKLRAVGMHTASSLVRFASHPLEELDANVVFASRAKLGLADVSATLDFAADLSHHPDARSAIAQKMLTRFADDCAEFATEANSRQAPTLALISTEVLNDLEKRHAACERVAALAHELLTLRDADAAVVANQLAVLHQGANAVAEPEHQHQPRERSGLRTRGVAVAAQQDLNSIRLRELHRLEQHAGSKAQVPLDFLFASIISTRGLEDLAQVNPWIADAEGLRDAVVACLLTASRQGVLNCCLALARKLHGLLTTTAATAITSSHLVRAISLEASALAAALSTKRHYVTRSTTFDPRFLLFEYTHNLVLRKAQVELVEEFVNAVRAHRPLVKQVP